MSASRSACVLGCLLACAWFCAAAYADGDPAASRFDVLELRVLGNTTLPARDIEQLIYPFLGTNKTLDDVEVARKALETLYHDRGYGTVFVDVPEQTVDKGIVRLKVTEASLRRVEVSGARYFSARQIRTALPAAKVGTTPALPALQEQLADLNRQTRDRSVVPVLKAGSEPGTVDLTLKVDDHLPLHASLELNNQYTAQTEPLRAIGSISYDHLFARFDSIGLQYQTAPQERSEVDVWMANYATHVSDDTRLALYYFKSDSEVATLGTVDASVTVLGKGQVAGARLIHALEGSAGSLHTLTLGVDYKDFLQNVGVQSIDRDSPDDSALTTPISYLNLSLGYSGGWRAGQRQWTFSASSNFGVRQWQNSATEFELKRFKANPNYIYFRSDGRIRFDLPARLNLQLSYSGQYAPDPIISNEQFAITGVDGVRGYLEAEELGDRGIKGSLEFGSPRWELLNNSLALDSFAFYDYGSMSLVQPLPSDRAHADVRSWGLGLRIDAFGMFTGVLTWAYPLTDSTQTRRGDDRFLFMVRSSW